MALILRPYQDNGLDKFEDFLASGATSGIYSWFTGAGKSVLAVELTRRFFHPKSGHRTVFVGGINQMLTLQMAANYRNLAPEMSGRITINGQIHKGLGIVMGTRDDVDARIICASMQTLVSSDELNALRVTDEMQPITREDVLVDSEGNIYLAPDSPRRWLISRRLDPILRNGGPITAWFHDEAHHAVSDGSVLIWNRLRELYELLGLKPIINVGFTATPMRSDERGLGTIYHKIIDFKDIRYGQRHGYLAPYAEPFRVVIDHYEDASGTVHFDEDGVAWSMVKNWPEIIAETWLEKCAGRPTFIYVGGFNGQSAIANSITLCKKMNASGIRTVHIDGMKCVDQAGQVQPKSMRGKYLEMLVEGELDAITNYHVLVEGIDVPAVSCILLARTVNPINLTQILGRAGRNAEGKEDMLLGVFVNQRLVTANIGTLMGYTVDPLSGEFVEDVEIDELASIFLQLWSEDKAAVQAWQVLQTRFSDSILYEATAKAIAGNQLDWTPKELRAVRECVEYLQDEDLFDPSGADLRDMSPAGTVQGKDKTYKVAKIISQSSNAWFEDVESGIMSLGIGPDQMLLIHPPHYAEADLARQLLEHVYVRLNGKSGQYKPLDDLTDNQVNQLGELLEFAYRLWSQFTLWHVDTSNIFRPGLVGGGGWVLANDALDVLEYDAIEYARAQDNYTDILSGKGKNWRYNMASEKQLNLIAKLLGKKLIGQVPEYYRTEEDRSGQTRSLRKGRAAQLISHIAGIRAIQRVTDVVREKLAYFKEEKD